MADENSNPPKAPVPPKPADAPKVQPKKETVRISLPPKPTSSATIKLPSVPAAAPKSAAPKPAAAPAKSAPSAAPSPPKPPAAGSPPAAAVAKSAPASSAPRPAPAAPAARRAPVAVKKGSPLDMALAIAAGVLGLGAVVSMLLLLGMK